jgi:type VI secretion system protein ImpK
MSDNPFAEPGDQDRTVIRPMPGGARRQSAAPPPIPIPGPAAGPELELVVAGDGPLAVAAAPLLNLLGRLRNAATAPDPGDMRERTRRELRAFERRAKDAGIPPDQLRLAHYALCAALDDVVLNTPWGNHGRWKDEPLCKALHDDDQAGRGFFEQLRTLRDAMPDARPVIELMFVCLSLGMMGPYRTAPDGTAQLARIRHRLFEMITTASSPVPTVLAPQTAGVDARAMPRRGGVPVWVGASVALAVVVGIYLWCSTSLNAASDTVLNTALAAPPASMPVLVRPPATPPPPPPPEPPVGPVERLRAAFAGTPEIEVVASPAVTILRMPAATLFPQPNATLADTTLLDRVAQALKTEPGAVRILVYADNQPVHTVGFPSAFALTTARAKAIRTALARTVPEPARITAEGRAAADPIAPNTTPDGREHNRRVDIVLATSP